MNAYIDDTPACRISERLADARRGVRRSSGPSVRTGSAETTASARSEHARTLGSFSSIRGADGAGAPLLVRCRHNEEMAVVGGIRAAAYRLAFGLLRAWWFARRPRSRGVRCILRSGDAVVLVRHSYGDRRWMLSGGRVRRGEDAIATARREMARSLASPASGGK
jgi:hypothetical protein